MDSISQGHQEIIGLGEKFDGLESDLLKLLTLI